jgi:hypothetical protein
MAVVARHPEWAIGYQDEVGWSRLAHPCLSAWRDEGQPLRLIEQTVAKDDTDPKALACYGLLVRLLDLDLREAFARLRADASRSPATL